MRAKANTQITRRDRYRSHFWSRAVVKTGLLDEHIAKAQKSARTVQPTPYRFFYYESVNEMASSYPTMIRLHLMN